ncbi:MAG: ParB N-terminal domain-containing protein, partial [Oscillospiraceae bacterium]|nr:ParB N-terminal domain-containing protein [Oscillospiraceae bacterium]
MANDNSKTPTTPQPQNIPLAKIHDLPGVTIFKQPDKSYGGLVTSIQAGGVKEPVILRLREDGEYQLVTGYRRRKASELAKKQEIPALVYEMTLQEAADYHRRVQVQPTLPVPGKLVEEKARAQAPDVKETKNPTDGDKEKATTDGKEKSPAPKSADVPSAPTVEGKEKEVPPVKAPQPAAEPSKDSTEEVPIPKAADVPPAPATEGKEKEAPPAKADQPGAEPSKGTPLNPPAP